ncbi:THAP domain-containing protein 9, partial [Trachymyrmex cornetzi]
VYQIVFYSNKFKIPIAHFFVNKISSETQSKLILVAIKKLYNGGVTVHSITCDGTSVNLATLQNLGCCFKSEKMKTYFKHPRKTCNIYAILDTCHMIKLARNAFADKELYNEKGKISFQYVKDLNRLQEDIGLKFANRLSSTHIYFKNKKMKVCLATQTIHYYRNLPITEENVLRVYYILKFINRDLKLKKGETERLLF